MQESVQQLGMLGPLPDQDADEGLIDKYADLLENTSRPVTNEEARVLVRLFGPDEAYGLAWMLLHLIETAPSWPLRDCLEERDNEWIRLLHHRAKNANE